MPDIPFEPLFARVLIKRDVVEKIGSLIIPDAKRRAPAKGHVVAVGPTCDGSIKPGMKVIFGKYAGTWLDENGSELDPDAVAQSKGWFVCVDEDIICVVKE